MTSPGGVLLPGVALGRRGSGLRPCGLHPDIWLCGASCVLERQEALERLAQGESQSAIARTFDVDRATISRLAQPLVDLD